MTLKFAVVAVVLVLCVQVIAAFTIQKRSLEGSSNSNVSAKAEPVELCQGQTPCGWAVYKKITRYIDYFMRNKCQCPKEKRCLRDEDDISITSYVYRCKILENIS